MTESREPTRRGQPRSPTRRGLLRLALASPLGCAAGLRPRLLEAATGAGPRIAIRPKSALAGGLLTIDGAGFPGKAKGRLVWTASGKRLGAFAADAAGRFRSFVTVPGSATSGAASAIRAKSGTWTAEGGVDVVAPEGDIALGAFVPGAPADPARLHEFQRRTGSDLGIVMWFQHWGLPETRAFDARLLDNVAAAGAVPLITWEPWHPDRPEWPFFALSEIAAGRHDAYVDGWAKRLKAWSGRVLLRWGHEMNGDWYPWSAGGNRPPRNARAYKAAWRRIHDRFARIGATNVEWVWAPNIIYPGAAPLPGLYPGDRYVDWIGIDGYNWGTRDGGGRWQTFAGLFEPTLRAVRQLAPSKPVLITETASAEEGGSKAVWIRIALLRDLPLRYPDIRGIVWFDEAKERDWSVDSSKGARRAFAAAAAHPYFRGRLADLPEPKVASAAGQAGEPGSDTFDRRSSRDRQSRRRRRRGG